jgi:hypothetical protein
LAALPHLHSLSLCGFFASDFPVLHQLPPPFFPSLTHLSFTPPDSGQEHVFASLSHCPRLTSLHLDFEGATIKRELVNCLAQLPLLRYLQLYDGDVDSMEPQTASARASLPSLCEIQLDEVYDAHRLLPLLDAAPTLRVLRWRCCALRYSEHVYWLPTLEPLSQLLTAAPLLQVELLMPRSLEQWYVPSSEPEASAQTAAELVDLRRRCWDELQQLPTQLPRVRIVDIEPDEQF